MTTSTSSRSGSAPQSGGRGIVEPEVLQYLAGLRPALDPAIQAIRDRGERDVVPIVNDEVGALLEILVRISQPQLVVEFGTAVGYSTAWMARALPGGGRLVSFELDPERHAVAGALLAEVQTSGDVDLRLGDARELMLEVEGPVDIAFLDATKGEYGVYLEWVLANLAPGGLVLVDNALMGGHVAGIDGEGDWTAADVAGQRAFNQTFVNDPRLVATILPVGDGLGVGVRT